ncbi:glycosyltransferase family 39 protein [Novosphingobium sp. KCTC 2891]|uniref:ArnT family glycosyltransferase n=1 Tax=Novosphingobium sp. KCTC 2891 TaxID=2989730 RepID=UPI002223238C|nr:glycosyltransferase family 39 protein [Novosphingobium sp. KCTC 2891]MCW1382732.1 glycosyltransferase family 39 protein [Novosphingobium sp. KCTC 2891]
MDAITAAADAPSVKARPEFLRRDGWAILAIVAASLLLRIWWFHSPVVDHDEQLYSLIGREMLEGRLPYVEVWDRKPILLFLIYAGAHALFGPDPAAYLVVADLFACLGAWLVFRMAALMADRATGLVAALLYLVGMGIYGCRGGQSELFFTVPCLAMTWLLLTRPGSLRALCWAMLLGGLAIQIKYTAAPFCAVFGLAALAERWRAHGDPRRLLREAVLFAALGLAPTLAVTLVYAALGHFQAFAYANFLSVFDRPPVTGRWHPRTLSVIGPLVLTIAAGVWAYFRTGRSYPPRSYGIIALMTLAALASIYFTANVIAYYYAFLVPWAVLLAVPFIDLRAGSGKVGAAILLAAFGTAANLPTRIAEGQRDERAFALLVAQVRAAGPHAGLYVFTGPTALYPATGHDGGVYPFASHHSNLFEAGALGRPQQALVAEALARKPAFIVTRPDYAAHRDTRTASTVMAEIRAHYAAAARVEILGDKLVLWKRHQGS